MKDKISIEETEYVDRTEFRVKIVGPYPPGSDAKGEYVRYISEYGENVHGSIIAYKETVWWKRLWGFNYDWKCKFALYLCDGIIEDYKHNAEYPKVVEPER